MSGAASPQARAKAVLQGGLGGLWQAGFRALSLARPSRARPWRSPGGLRALVVAPHPDDEVAGCAGTLSLHRLAGDAVSVAVVSDGRRSRAGGRGPEEMRRQRRGEAEAVAAALDYELRWLDLPEAEWREAELVESLGAIQAALRPDVVYAPSLVDFHPEHLRVAVCLARALPVACPSKLRVYPVQVPLTACLANLVSPVGSRMACVAAAMRAYASQTTSLWRCLRARRYTGARHALGEPAEEFWEMTADEYRSLHVEASVTGGSFRGLRDLALSDPLAYVAGRGARRRLAARLHPGGA